MFDVSFSELLLIGVIALVVIGPERLPKVARTVGHLLGRAQRYVNEVKTDIRREMDVDEMKNLKGQMEDAAQSMRASMQEASDSFRQPFDDAQEALKSTAADFNAATRLTDTSSQTASTESVQTSPAPATANDGASATAPALAPTADISGSIPASGKPEQQAALLTPSTPASAPAANPDKKNETTT